ncbi:MAG: T9SS type A sorting domain-containing protein [candidate division WOR-3 bacterium]
MPENNLRNDSCQVSVRVWDVGPSQIVSPVGQIDSGAVIAPQAWIRNFGNQAVTFPVAFRIDTFYSRNRTVNNLAPGESTLVSFADWIVQQRGPHTAVCSTALVTDQNRANDTLSASLDVTVSDVGTVCLLAPLGRVDSGATVTPLAWVKNYGSTTPPSFPTILRIGDFYADTQHVVGLPPGDSTLLSFSPWTALQHDSHLVSCSTALAADHVPVNNTRRGWVRVITSDVGLQRIVAPIDTVDSGSVVTPSCWVGNFGITPATFPVHLRITKAWLARSPELNGLAPRAVLPESDSALVSDLAPGESTEVFFGPWNVPSRGSYAVKCSTGFAEDRYATNYTLSARVAVRVRDVAATAILVPSGTIDSGTVVVPRAKVRNLGTEGAAFPVWFRIDSVATRVWGNVLRLADRPGLELGPSQATPGLQYRLPEMFVDSVWLSLAAGESALVSFDSWPANSVGDLSARVQTELVEDLVPGNDTSRVIFQVRAPRHDVGVNAITAPVGGIDTLPKIPRVRVRNYGERAESFWVFFRIQGPDSAIVYFDSGLVVNLGAGEQAEADLPVWDGIHAIGRYAAIAFTAGPSDVNRSNDTARGFFAVTRVPLPLSWSPRSPVPPGGRNRNVRDGGCLAYRDWFGDGYIYALKGNNTFEFYEYSVSANTWTTLETIPAIGRSGTRKAVKRGATIAGVGDWIFATKGNNTLEWWRYSAPTRSWYQFADIPAGPWGRRVKEAACAAAVNHEGVDYIYFLKGSNTAEFYRYNVATDQWELMASAPLGPSGKAYRRGSALAYNPEQHLIYLLKGYYNEFYAYDIRSNTWQARSDMPLVGASGRRKRTGHGAALAYLSSSIYGLKGNNTNEFYRYNPRQNAWVELDEIPIGSGKRVSRGGALVYVPCAEAIFGLKGNNTLEFWSYCPVLVSSDCPKPGWNSAGGSAGHPLSGAEKLLTVSPNPMTDMAIIRFATHQATTVSLKLYDVSGTLVRTLFEGTTGQGTSVLTFAPSSLARGIYLLRLESKDQTVTEKVLIQ